MMTECVLVEKRRNACEFRPIYVENTETLASGGSLFLIMSSAGNNSVRTSMNSKSVEIPSCVVSLFLWDLFDRVLTGAGIVLERCSPFSLSPSSFCSSSSHARSADAVYSEYAGLSRVICQVLFDRVKGRLEGSEASARRARAERWPEPEAVLGGVGLPPWKTTAVLTLSQNGILTDKAAADEAVSVFQTFFSHRGGHEFNLPKTHVDSWRMQEAACAGISFTCWKL